MIECIRLAIYTCAGTCVYMNEEIIYDSYSSQRLISGESERAHSRKARRDVNEGLPSPHMGQTIRQPNVLAPLLTLLLGLAEVELLIRLPSRPDCRGFKQRQKGGYQSMSNS